MGGARRGRGVRDGCVCVCERRRLARVSLAAGGVYIRVRDRDLVVQCLLDVPLSIKSSDFCIYIIYMMYCYRNICIIYIFFPGVSDSSVFCYGS